MIMPGVDTDLSELREIEAGGSRVAERVTAQSVLFAGELSRLQLMQLKLATGGSVKRCSINVWRNHAIEPVLSLCRPYLQYAKLEVDFRLGAYDDSLMFNGHAAADVELLWLDSDRYLKGMDFDEWIGWVEDRIRSLRALTHAPVLLVSWFQAQQEEQAKVTLEAMPGVYVANIALLCSRIHIPLLDSRTSAISGTPISKEAQLYVSRKLVCHWLSSLVLGPIKAIAVDLDNTLHGGVLAEQGVSGLQLTEAHRSLQLLLKVMRERGIFVALVSRNERADVESLFAERDDYPLKFSDFSVVEVSWGDKGEAIKRVAHQLRIDPNAILFVDDNPGEIISVMKAAPSIHPIYANEDANITCCTIEYHPGLWRWKSEQEDTPRIEDLKATGERERLLATAVNYTDYFQSLEVTLVQRHNPMDQLVRLADLCVKTNQFNLALRRLNEVELALRMRSDDGCVSSVGLTDRLADSGIIGVVAAELLGRDMVVDELCISCRALGRNLEDYIVIPLIRDMPIFSRCDRVIFKVQQGPRNAPAIAWFNSIHKAEWDPFVVPADHFINFKILEGVTIIRGNDGQQ